jgi:transposase
MAQYTMHSSYASHIAIDQHARSVTMRGLDLLTGETQAKRLTNCPTAKDITDWARSWATGPMRFAYESGPCGNTLAREIRALGHACDIIAVSSIARSAEDKLFKDDRRDAARLLAEMVSPHSKCKTVWILDAQTEAARSLVRAYYDAVDATRRSKLQLSAFLLRHGHVWNERTGSGKLKKTWTRGYLDWIRSIKLGEEADRATLSLYLTFAQENIQRARTVADRLGKLAGESRYKPYVDALCRLKGVDPLTAITFITTVGDFSRFKNGRSVSSYFGLIPKRHDSGERCGRSGHMTKAGDSTTRRAVIESLVGIENFKPTAKALAKGAAAASRAVEAEALKCNIRNVERYSYLKSRGKSANVAKAAVASELVRDMWVIGRMVKEEMAQMG